MTTVTRTFSAFAAVIVTALLAVAPLATPSMANDVSGFGQQRSNSDNGTVIAERVGGAMDGSVAA